MYMYMRVYPFDLRAGPLQRHRLVDVELSLERVMRECGAGRYQRGSRGQGSANSESHAQIMHFSGRFCTSCVLDLVVWGLTEFHHGGADQNRSGAGFSPTTAARWCD